MKANIVLVLLLVASAFFIGFGFKQSAPLGGNYGPQISADSIINSSSSIGTGGLILWTNASNTGDWFRITNGGAGRVVCALGNSTDTVQSEGGQLLVPITSSTGDNVWEMWGARGGMACRSNLATFVTWSFSGR